MKYLRMLLDIFRYIASDYKLEPTFYLSTNTDLSSVKRPLEHYIFHGKKEGRYCCEKQLLDNHVKSGLAKFNPKLETIIIASHESSGTGAPLVGLNLAKEWSEKYNIISVVLRESNIHSEFVNSSMLVLSNIHDNPGLCLTLLSNLLTKYKVRGVYCNSVETYPVLLACSELMIPTVSLVHEFNDYTRPVGKLVNTVISADNVVVPANIIKQSLYEEFEIVMGPNKIPNNITILPQGKLNYFPDAYGENLSSSDIRKKFKLSEKTKVVVGAGYVQPRKGVDIFVDIAKKLKDKYGSDFVFIWIGGGYNPEHDLNYSVWIRKQLIEFDLLDNVYFLEHQRSINPLLELANVFLLTSRLDPFPNVVIDALSHNTNVVCFNNASGFADFFNENNADASVVDYLDVDAASDKIIDVFVRNKKENKNKLLVDEKLNFSRYAKELELLLDKSVLIVNKQHEMTEIIQSSNKFDPSFFNQKLNLDNSIKMYIKYSSKGLHVSSPLPGFSNLQWIKMNGASNYTVPLYEDLLLGSDGKTHECVEIDPNVKSVVLKEQKIAIHLHLFYIDLAEEFASYFKSISSPFDLFITSCDTLDETKIEKIFAITNVNKLVIKKVPNIGRDVGPLFLNLRDEIFYSDYDLLGHFHSKKSVETEGIGDHWRKYLLTNLIGTESYFNQIQNIMLDEKIGLLFTEDMHEVDFGKNKSFIDDLCFDLNIDSPEFSLVFPLGTMFWAKPKALLPLAELDFSKYLQEEPLPYDGSYMHAIERIIPTIVNSTDSKWVTVYHPNTNW